MQTEALHRSFPMPQNPGQLAAGGAFRSIRRAFWLVRFLYRRQQQRRQLLTLDAHLLDDIGVTAEMARKEGNKPFWRD